MYFIIFSNAPGLTSTIIKGYFFKEGDRRKQETVKKQEGEERKEEG